MANLLGIDIGKTSIRVALLRTGYRKLFVEALKECSVADYPSVTEAVHALAAPLWVRGESIATNLPGDKVFIRRLELPATALRQLAEVLPFELEAQLPFDLAEAVFDSRILPSAVPGPIQVLAVVARTADVGQRIGSVNISVSQEPERVDPGAFALANLVGVTPELSAPGPLMLVHLDADLTDIVVLVDGQVEFARTLSAGTAGLPASAAPLSRDLRQTVAAWRALGGAMPQAIYLCGPGAQLSGAQEYLSSEAGVPVSPLPTIQIDNLLDEQGKRFAHAIGLAMGLAPRARSMNLRRGPLAYERGFGFLREKVPLLAGLGTLILVSFLFATWMEYRALSKQNAVLQEALAQVTKDVFGEELRDPEAAMDKIGVGSTSADDPMPYIDAFDLMVQISKVVPEDVVHDIEELDFQKDHAVVHGVVPTIPDAQHVAAALQAVQCFKNVKIVRTNQVVNDNRQKYVLELDVKCEQEAPKAVAKTEGNPAAAQEAP